VLRFKKKSIAVPVQTMKEYEGSGSIAPFIFKLSTDGGERSTSCLSCSAPWGKYTWYSNSVYLSICV